MSIINIGVRALQVDQMALQTASNNIANVNTPGYSRQTVQLVNVPGQFMGSGFIGKGVDAITVTRAYDEFLTRQAAAAQSIATGDSTRLNKLTQLENYFQGGENGLGASISNMLNSFSDIVSAPTDLTARSVTLTRADEMASRFNQMYMQLDQLRIGNIEQLKTDVAAINSLAQQIAQSNDQIARALGSGHAPNDLMDRRDQLIRDLNKYIQTTQIKADDGSINIFVASSHPLVLGTTVSPVSIVNDDFNNLSKVKLAISVGGNLTKLDEAMLGGGEVSGLLRFQNTDLVDANNLLGRMALAIGTKMNEQQTLGLDLDGNPGTALFNLAAMPNGFPATTNIGAATLGLGMQTNPLGVASFVATDYEFNFTSATTGVIRRVSDGTSTAFDFGATNPVLIDGLTVTLGGGAAAAGDRILLKPFSTAAGTIDTAFSSPRNLAMASPVAASANINNAGSLSLVNLSVLPPVAPQTVTGMVAATTPVTLTFTGPGTYTRSDTGATVYSYAPGQAIPYTVPPATPQTGWTLTLKGLPQAGDTYTVAPNPYPQLNADNAQAMLGLRDTAMFDGGPLTDGYASVMAQIGTRLQTAKSASIVSADIAVNLEKERTSVSSVNLDEEAARLIQYQQAYQAASKMIQIAQNIFDTLIQNLGR